MKASFLHQPVGPEEQRLGHQLRNLLVGREGPFDEFFASVAFAKASGVSRLYGALQAFRSKGGKSRVVVGIDRRGTSRQALELLRQVVDEVFVYHHEGYTFHPKLYLLVQARMRATVLVGSGNLTAGGLFTNYEGHVRLELDLASTEDQGILSSLVAFSKQNCESKSGCTVPLTDEVLRILEPRLLDEASEGEAEGPEDEAMSLGHKSIVREGTDGAAEVFGTIAVKPAPIPDVFYPRGKRRNRRPIPGQPTRVGGSDDVSSSGRASKLQRTVAPGAPGLLAEIPRASTRWNQANFNKQDFTEFFRADSVRGMRLWHIHDDGSIAPHPEVRPGVSVKSRNFRIELGAAAGRDYPSDGRPIGAFVRVRPTEFGYMLLMPGTQHHQRAEEILGRHSTSARGRVRRVRMPVEAIMREWPGSPLWEFAASRRREGRT